VTAGGAWLKVEGLTQSFDGRPVFANLSFELEPGRSLALVGASGCGKTTILRAVAGLIEAGRGRVSVGPGRPARAMVSQDLGLLPWKTAFANVELPLRLAGRPRAERRRRAEEVLALMELTELAGRYPASLSGGQRQRLALGRALVGQPELLVLDEPFSALDAISREALGDHLAGLWKRLGWTMVLATHSIEEAVLLGETVLVLGGSPTVAEAAFANPDAGEPGGLTRASASALAREVRLALAAVRGRASSGAAFSGPAPASPRAGLETRFATPADARLAGPGDVSSGETFGPSLQSSLQPSRREDPRRNSRPRAAASSGAR
jgi:NitT/TauT family transport system ATP-binding protein